MSGRRRTAKSLANDAVVRRAVVDEIAASGVDRVGPTAVARRAGFTTGAVYGRYENTAEMVVDAWLEEVWPRFSALLDAVVAVVVDGADPGPGGVDAVVADLVDPPPWLLAGTEMLAVAHRHEELGEVVIPQMAHRLDAWAAGTGAPPRRRADVLLATGAVIGMGLHDLAGLPSGADEPVLAWYRRAVATDAEAPAPLPPMAMTDVAIDTGDPVSDLLLAASIEVIADVGFERATTSRIARRAGLGTNWIYAEHDSKQELLLAAVEAVVSVLDPGATVGDLTIGRSVATPLGAAGLALAAILEPHRRTASRVRLEAFLCARHYPPVVEQLSGLQSELIGRYVDAARLGDPMLAEVGRPVVLFLAAEVVGLPVLDSLVGPLTDVDWRQGLLPLEQVAIEVWRQQVSG